jgi:hypothetical protein
MTKIDKGSQPPVTITGVAPWAMMNSNNSNNPISGGPMTISQAPTGGIMGNTNRANPPVTITGVAPWKLQQKESGSPSLSMLSPPPISVLPENLAQGKTTSQSPPTTVTIDGKAMMCGYMVKCYEDVFNDKMNGNSAESKEWNQLQNSVQPKLLPTLKFHDLVFGQILGEGAFSTVKYARHITKGKPQSLWPEYAVKIIDAKKVLEHNYSLSVIREICVLQIIQHPNISRLISAFQYNQSAYLILEYGKNGDLHTFLVNSGKIADHHLIR